MLRRMLSLATLALSLGAAACSGELDARQRELAAQLVEQIRQAPASVPHRGLREIQIHYTVDGEPLDLAYVEEIVTDGEGNFAIDTREALTPVRPDEYTFKQLQKVRQRYFFEYRDFIVRNLDRFLENYRVEAVDQNAIVAGRRCYQLEVARLVGRGGHVTVALDAETGLVLRTVERDASGAVLSSMEYVTFEEHPDLTNVVFAPPSRFVDLELGPQAAQELGFEPWIPDYVPAGFAVDSVSRRDGPDGRNWMKVVYLDGAEPVTFMHGGPVQSESSSAETHPFGAAAGGSQALVFEIGPVTVVQGTIDSQQLIAFGKVSPDELLHMIDSARP